MSSFTWDQAIANRDTEAMILLSQENLKNDTCYPLHILHIVENCTDLRVVKCFVEITSGWTSEFAENAVRNGSIDIMEYFYYEKKGKSMFHDLRMNKNLLNIAVTANNLTTFRWLLLRKCASVEMAKYALTLTTNPVIIAELQSYIKQETPICKTGLIDSFICSFIPFLSQ